MNSNFDFGGWPLEYDLVGSPECGGVGDANVWCFLSCFGTVAGPPELTGRSAFVAAAADGVAWGVGSAPLFVFRDTGAAGCTGVDWLDESKPPSRRLR
jgi:hypothetical protein